MTFRPRILVYEDELERIGRHVVDRRHLETGGELYGLLTASGSLVLHLATGPGPRARHAPASFHQDRAFLRETFALANERHGLQHLGTWHSHHGLSLAEPSGGDDASMVSALGASGLPAFLLVIANLVDSEGRPDHGGLPELRGFLYRKQAPRSPLPCEWIVLLGASPVRETDSLLAGVDSVPAHPHATTRVAPQTAGAMSSEAAFVSQTAVSSNSNTFAAGPEPDLALAHALRSAPWALEDAGAVFVERLVDELKATRMVPNEVGELVIHLPDGVFLTLGAMEDEHRLTGALVVGDQYTDIKDVTGSPDDLLDRVRALLAEAAVEFSSAGSRDDRLLPRATSL